MAAYRQKGDIRFSETGEGARSEIVRDYLADLEQRPDGTRVAMAHRRVDVRAINADIRSALQDSHRLARGRGPGEDNEPNREQSHLGRELTFQTNDGSRDFAPGDRLVFLENDRDLGVKNGMLGTVQTVELGAIRVQLDGGAGRSQENDRIVTIPTKSYQSFDHGYATTIHKTQGATVDRAYVMASQTMDRHLTYVAMTRHRDGVQLYASQDEFTDCGAGKRSAPGRLVEHGKAPYENNPKNRDSYFVTLEHDRGQQHTVWGVDLERAMKDAAPEVGARIGLEHAGSETVRLPNGKTAERNIWKVHGADELAFKALEDRLSRVGVKETTLDYTRDFANRRGIAQQIGIRSEIEVDHAAMQRQDQGSPAAHLAREHQDRLAAETGVHDERLRLQAGPERGREDPTQDDPGRNPGGDRQRELLAEKAAPLVPAITRHDRSIEDVAREKAMPVFEQRFEAVRLIALHVFRDPAEVAGRLKAAIIEKEGNGKVIAKAMAEQPERFGDLRGKTGLLGDNKERKAALHSAKAVAAHIGSSAEGWEWLLGEEQKSEQWQREKRDVVEVPGLTQRSAEIIAQVAKTPTEKRGQLIDELRSTPDGQAALAEAKLVVDALQQRFGHPDPRNFAKELEQRPELAKHA